MVVIGETGAGKTSLIELILNCVEQEQSFDLSKLKKLTKEEYATAMQSRTTKINYYDVKAGDFSFLLIDTPGFADTRGDDQNKLNMDNIISHMKEQIYINCVCLVINGSQSRLSKLMKDVLNDITTLLLPEIRQNIIIAFTKIKDEDSLNFDLEILNEEFGIYVLEERKFLFDNPWSRWQTALARQRQINSEKLCEEFTEAQEVLTCMYKTIRDYKPVSTCKFGELRRTIDAIKLRMTELKIKATDKKCLTEKITLMKENVGTQMLIQRFEIETTDALPTKEKNLICIANNCNSTCHPNCKCFWTGGFLGKISRCSCFNEDLCKCGHSPEDHIKTNFKFQRRTQTIKAMYGNQSLDVNVTIEAKQKDIREDELKLYSFDEQIQATSEILLSEMEAFQIMGPNYFFFKVVKPEIKYLLGQLDQIPSFDCKKEVKCKLSQIEMIGNNPFIRDISLSQAKILWACGMLGIDHKNIMKEDIDREFRKLSPRHHPDSNNNEHANEELFKQYNHAKDILLPCVNQP